MDVAANVGYGLRREGVARTEIAERVSEVLALVRLEGLGDRRPAQLSGGQRQRVALARALIAGARVIVLDDPLSAVDTHTEHDLVGRLRPALTRRTVIVAAQRLSTLALADRAAVLDDGRVVEEGRPADLLERRALFADLFGDELGVA